MTEFVSQAEFEALLNTEAEEALEPVAVFVAPKPTDRGFHRVRTLRIEFARKQTGLQAEQQGAQAKMTLLKQEVDAVDERMAQWGRERERLRAALDEARAAGDEARVTLTQAALDEIGRQTAAAEGEQKAALEQMMGLLGTLDELMVKQAAFNEEQLAFLSQFVRAIKYPPTEPGGSWRYWPRPYGGEDLERFEAAARERLAGVSEQEFQAMLQAALGQAGQAAVPPK